MSEEPKPVNCKCGMKAHCGELYYCFQHRVFCNRARCWDGPIRKTPAAAVKAWDKVMEKESK